MATFNSIEDFIEYAKPQIESAMKNDILPKIKEKAQEIVLTKIYSVYTPKVYQRTMELLDSFQIETKWEGSTYWGILKVKSDLHSDNPTWKGTIYPLDEIINYYFAEGHGWGDGANRPAVDTLSLTNQEMIETGEALELLLNELKKYFDIR
jgi:hypothetical protein